MSSRAWTGGLLLVAVVATGWLALELRPRQEEPAFVGAPRPDYSMRDYELVVLDESGAQSFTVSGPQLDRDPFSAEITLDQPLFTFPSEDGEWTARAINGWVSAEADELRLTRRVELDGPPVDALPSTRVRTEALSVRPGERTAHSAEAVTIERGNSILSGRGLDAELDSRRLQLHSEVRMRHEPNPPRATAR